MNEINSKPSIKQKYNSKNISIFFIMKSSSLDVKNSNRHQNIKFIKDICDEHIYDDLIIIIKLLNKYYKINLYEIFNFDNLQEYLLGDYKYNDNK
jgi:hypothetical protein